MKLYLCSQALLIHDQAKQARIWWGWGLANSHILQGSVVRNVDSGIHWVVIFSTATERDNIRDTELTRDESDFNSKMLNFNMGSTSY